MIDPKRLRPGEVCRLVNSTPLGEVLSQAKLRAHRNRAGVRIGDTKHVDLIRYVAWLFQQRHDIKAKSTALAPPIVDLPELAAGAAASRCEPVKGHGRKLDRKQEAAIAALLVEPTYAAAAAKAGVGETTLYRWLNQPEFRVAFQQARRVLVDSAMARIQAATGQAVETLVGVARQGRRDGDRVRAAALLLEHAVQGLTQADLLHGGGTPASSQALGLADLVRLLAGRLQQLDVSELPTAEKARLTIALGDALARAINMDDLEKRLEALEQVIGERKEKKR